MIEEFVKRGLDLLRGTTDEAMPQKAGTHGDKDKLRGYSCDLMSMQLIGSIYAVLDLANTNSTSFHKFCKVGSLATRPMGPHPTSPHGTPLVPRSVARYTALATTSRRT